MVFGGIVEYIGSVDARSQKTLRVSLDSRHDIFTVKVGDSIAVNGVCVTVKNILKTQLGDTSSLRRTTPPRGATATTAPTVIEFDLSAETIRRTTFDDPPQRVHVEPALRFGDRVGGHVISGHVHGVGIFCSLDKKTGEMCILLPMSEFRQFESSREDAVDNSSKCYDYLAPTFKSSIAVDGISLTVSNVDADTGMVTIALIPHTLRNTLFANMRSGTLVNVELNCGTEQVCEKSMEITRYEENKVSRATSCAVKEGTAKLTKQPPVVASSCSLSVAEQTVLSATSVYVVQAQWHRHLGDSLVNSILSLLTRKYGIRQINIKHILVPGSLELPRAIQHINDTRLMEVDASFGNMIDQRHCPVIYLAVGILIKGDTDHYDLVSKDTHSALTRLGMDSKLWIVNSLLACHDVKQAEERCKESFDSCVAPHMANAVARLSLLGFL